MDQKHTPHNVDKITILSLDRLECWSGFMKLLVGKKDFSRKQSTGRKRVNIDPPTFHLKHGMYFLDTFHFIYYFLFYIIIIYYLYYFILLHIIMHVQL